jgi:hypothetical protein
MQLSKDSRIEVVSEIGRKLVPKNYLNRLDMEECDHVLKQFIKSDSMNSEECKT